MSVLDIPFSILKKKMKFISSLMHNSIVITEVKKMLVNFFGVGIVLFFVKEGKYYFFKMLNY